MASGLHPSLLVSDKINYKLWTEDTACSQLLRAPGHLLTQANSVDASTSLAGIKPWYHVCRSRHKASQHTLKQNKPVTPLFHWGQALQHTLKWNKPVTPLFHWGQSLQHTLKWNKPVTPLFHWGQSLQHTLKWNKPVTLLFWGQSRPWNGTSLWHFCSNDDSQDPEMEQACDTFALVRTVTTKDPEMEQACDTFVLVRTVITFYRVGDREPHTLLVSHDFHWPSNMCRPPMRGTDRLETFFGSLFSVYVIVHVVCSI